MDSSYHVLHCSAEALREQVRDDRASALGSTPVHHACREVAMDTMYSLLDQSADPGARNDLGDTPLHHAPNGDVVVVLLGGRRVGIDVQNDQWRTPLHESIVLNRSAVSRALVNAGADLTVRNNKGMSALDYECMHEDEALMETMIRSGRVDPRDADKTSGLTPLHWAQGKAVVDALVDAGCSVYARDIGGRTPLHLGWSKSNITMCALLSRGADVGALDGQSHTPLHFFSKVDREHLVEKGAAVNALNHEGETPLHHATRGGSPGVVGVLLRFGADHSLRGLVGRIPLELDVLAPHLGVVREICRSDRGVDVNAVGRRGEISLHYAAFVGNVAVVKVLLAAGADFKRIDGRGISPLHYAVSKEHLGVVDVLVERGAEVNAQYRGGITALQCAARVGSYGVANALLVAGANVDHRSRSGNTALAFAAAGGFFSIVDVLVSNGADVTQMMRERRP